MVHQVQALLKPHYQDTAILRFKGRVQNPQDHEKLYSLPNRSGPEKFPPEKPGFTFLLETHGISSGESNTVIVA